MEIAVKDALLYQVEVTYVALSRDMIKEIISTESRLNSLYSTLISLSKLGSTYRTTTAILYVNYIRFYILYNVRNIILCKS